VVRLLNLTYN